MQFSFVPNPSLLWSTLGILLFCHTVSFPFRIGRSDDVLFIVKECKDAVINIYFQKENLNIFQEDGKPNPFWTSSYPVSNSVLAQS